MAIKRLTKEEIRNTAGIINPIGHVIVAFPDDAVTADAVKALHEAGYGTHDVLAYTAAEATPRLRERVHSASQASTFGYEITLMRRYLAYAEEGSGWVIVYAPTDESVERLVAIAKQFNAKCAVRYHRLASEDLIGR